MEFRAIPKISPRVRLSSFRIPGWDDVRGAPAHSCDGRSLICSAIAGSGRSIVWASAGPAARHAAIPASNSSPAPDCTMEFFAVTPNRRRNLRVHRRATTGPEKPGRNRLSA